MLSSPAFIQRIGAQHFQGAFPAGTTNLVTGAANTSGLILRTAAFVSSPTGATEIWIATRAVMIAGPNGFFSYIGTGFLVLPGAALQIFAGAAGGSGYLTWDVL